MSRKTAKPHKEAAVEPAPVRGFDVSGFLERHAAILSVALVLAATVRIAATYPVFNHTIDEPAHIACGMERLDRRTYRMEPQHPPLARVIAAVGPYLAGRRSQGRDTIYNEGAAILYQDGRYDRNLTLARMGILPFFWLAAGVVFVWGRRHFGSAVAVASVFLFTMLPPVLAHAGLATTDMALASLLGSTFLLLMIWLETPRWSWAVLLGLSGGLLVVSKFTSLLFFPAAAAGLAAMMSFQRREWRRPAATRAAQLALALTLAASVVWAVYGFSVGQEPFRGWTVPAPELFAGIQQVMDHNAQGHPSYLLGQRSTTGFWNYYAVVIAVKSPAAFLMLSLAGIVMAVRRRRTEPRLAWPLVFAAAVFLPAQFGSIHIGVRHILPVYLGLSILAAAAAVELTRRSAARRWTGWAVGAAFVWILGTSAASHPDYLPYFNFLAGSQPEKVLADSDLDWGQDMKRLGTRLRELGAASVAFDPFISAYLEKWHGFPPIQPDTPDIPAPGYHAVSLTVLKVTRMGLGDRYPELVPWPERFPPLERVGQGTLLYYFPGR